VAHFLPFFLVSCLTSVPLLRLQRQLWPTFSLSFSFHVRQAYRRSDSRGNCGLFSPLFSAILSHLARSITDTAYCRSVTRAFSAFTCFCLCSRFCLRLKDELVTLADPSSPLLLSLRSIPSRVLGSLGRCFGHRVLFEPSFSNSRIDSMSTLQPLSPLLFAQHAEESQQGGTGQNNVRAWKEGTHLLEGADPGTGQDVEGHSMAVNLGQRKRAQRWLCTINERLTVCPREAISRSPPICDDDRAKR